MPALAARAFKVRCKKHQARYEAESSLTCAEHASCLEHVDHCQHRRFSLEEQSIPTNPVVPLKNHIG
jgi:hypothetical protein